MTTPETAVSLRCIKGRRQGQVSVYTPPFTVGTANTSDCQLSQDGISSLHGEISFDGGVLFYTDHRSLNGTIHRRGDALTPLGGRLRRAELWNGDRLELGDPINPVVFEVVLDARINESVIASRRIDDVDAFTPQVTQKQERLAALFTHSAELKA